jgi:DNA transformation protein
MPSPITNPFVLHACELLGAVGFCSARRMFGGWGLSVEGMNIGLVLNDTLYLKTNAATQAQWLAAGGVPFVYQARGRPVKLNYMTPPPDALESPGLMLPWARLALDAALAARTSADRPAVKTARTTTAQRTKA